MRQSEPENVAKALALNNFASENVSNILNPGENSFSFIKLLQTPIHYVNVSFGVG